MQSPYQRIWRSTTENAIWICYAINTLFSLNGTMLWNVTTLTVIGIVLYYVHGMQRREPVNDVKPARDTWRMVAQKLWHITQANGIYLAIGISAIFYLEGRLFVNAVIMTIIGYTLFYIYAYDTIQSLPQSQSETLPFAWRPFLRNFWSITEANILFLAGALSLLLYVTGKPLFYTALYLGIGFIMFYRDALATYSFPPNWYAPHTSSDVHLFFTKLWRITCANALGISGGISLLIFVEKQVFTLALVLTVVSLVIFYVVAYRDMEDDTEPPVSESFSLQIFTRRLIRITMANALWLFVGVTYIFFATGVQMIYLALLTCAGFVLLYIDEYRRLMFEENHAA